MIYTEFGTPLEVVSYRNGKAFAVIRLLHQDGGKEDIREYDIWRMKADGGLDEIMGAVKSSPTATPQPGGDLKGE